mmetsp:Transcript_24464/g.81300  ORF Transcript_24464/g.81300 Transcript_24464/m.81300 type:complete len:246 (+) Transcript_24464:427-1164(+)
MMSEIHMFSFLTLRKPSNFALVEETLLSCSCSPSVLRNSGSISMTRFRSKAPMSRTQSGDTSALVQRWTGACELIDLSRFSTRSRSSSETRSVLLSRIRSAKATCSTASFSAPSGFSSSRCCSMCFASTSVTIASSRACSLMDSSMKKVCATGPGSASPVVSITTASSRSRRLKSLERMRMRSPRTVQQMQPLFISKMSSDVSYRCCTSASSTPTSPNSFSITAILLPWLAVRMWLSRVVLPEPK